MRWHKLQSLKRWWVQNQPPKKPLTPAAQSEPSHSSQYLPEDWATLTSRFESYESVPAAQASAALLKRATACDGKVIARPWMHDLTFARVGDEPPFDEFVRVSWRDGIYTFTLRVNQALLVAAADKSREQNALAVLNSFLVQLTGDYIPASAS